MEPRRDPRPSAASRRPQDDLLVTLASSQQSSQSTSAERGLPTDSGSQESFQESQPTFQESQSTLMDLKGTLSREKDLPFKMELKCAPKDNSQRANHLTLKSHMKVRPKSTRSDGTAFVSVFDPVDGSRYVMCGHCDSTRIYRRMELLQRHLQKCSEYLKTLSTQPPLPRKDACLPDTQSQTKVVDPPMPIPRAAHHPAALPCAPPEASPATFQNSAAFVPSQLPRTLSLPTVCPPARQSHSSSLFWERRKQVLKDRILNSSRISISQGSAASDSGSSSVCGWRSLLAPSKRADNASSTCGSIQESARHSVRRSWQPVSRGSLSSRLSCTSSIVRGRFARNSLARAPSLQARSDSDCSVDSPACSITSRDSRLRISFPRKRPESNLVNLSDLRGISSGHRSGGGSSLSRFLPPGQKLPERPMASHFKTLSDCGNSLKRLNAFLTKRRNALESNYQDDTFSQDLGSDSSDSHSLVPIDQLLPAEGRPIPYEISRLGWELSSKRALTASLRRLHNCPCVSDGRSEGPPSESKSPLHVPPAFLNNALLLCSFDSLLPDSLRPGDRNPSTSRNRTVCEGDFQTKPRHVSSSRSPETPPPGAAGTPVCEWIARVCQTSVRSILAPTRAESIFSSQSTSSSLPERRK
uniref:Uncharacterized protein n=1 Tax=Chromera velia CCMP2878 TaxID=1169474 RepID=A0A0G4IBU3_9ALVE|eukprot:Cvel_12931.t1-p1 / transcript=Cvel_12931.t1 / gene=Cvel_12931 / organism=Chromera_velia_CCMP2878 / gene_product=hypothetical protein / transcript_product=hypothetical protein / location=Cvel_scaffold865:2102-5576(+) / protein_length=640 / sequence_SO=supercontig / SO=protein_coding / is_pseudo=false